MEDVKTIQAIEQALGTVIEPELHRDLMSLNMVKNIVVKDNHVSMTIVLTTPACPLKDRISNEVTAAVRGAVPQITDVEINWDAKVSSRGGLPGRQEVPGVKNIIAVSAGKGGVGKTTVSVNVALALAKTGATVGLLDADLYGPNVPIMLGIEQPPTRTQEKLLPVEAHGIKVISFGMIIEPGQPVVWRGPMLAKGLREFLYEVAWGELDYLVIDLPPGTGDVQLSLAQSAPLTGAIIVTTPQDVSIADVSRGIAMFKQLKVPVLGIVENMSGFVCENCSHHTDVFGNGGGQLLAERFGLPLLGKIPLEPSIRIGNGSGQPLMTMADSVENPSAKLFSEIASHIAAEVSKANFAATAGPVMPSGPRIPVVSK